MLLLPVSVPCGRAAWLQQVVESRHPLRAGEKYGFLAQPQTQPWEPTCIVLGICISSRSRMGF